MGGRGSSSSGGGGGGSGGGSFEWTTEKGAKVAMSVSEVSESVSDGWGGTATTGKTDLKVESLVIDGKSLNDPHLGKGNRLGLVIGTVPGTRQEMGAKIPQTVTDKIYASRYKAQDRLIKSEKDWQEHQRRMKNANGKNGYTF